MHSSSPSSGRTILFTLIAICATLGGPSLTHGEPVSAGPVTAELITRHESWQPGKEAWIGLRLDHDEGWHTYWKASATGYATSLEWELPEGIEVSEIHWPAPRTYEMAGEVEYVYEDELVLPVRVSVSPEVPAGRRIELRAKADWLACQRVCIPGQADLVTSVPISLDTPAVNEPWVGLFEEWERSHPVEPSSAAVEARREGGHVLLQFSHDAALSSLTYFDEELAIDPKAEQTHTQLAEGRHQLMLRTNPDWEGPIERLRGVLVSEPGFGPEGSERAWKIEVAVTGTGSGEVATPGAASVTSSFTAILGLAFLGGLILNLMPCVFPVIGIKIMGFVNQAGEEKAKIVQHGLVFTLGVLISFWTLALVLILLRAGGQELGWGFQLQSPAFVFFLAMFLFLFGLNMSGLFEVGQGAVGVGSGLTAKSGYTGTFFSGVLATVVATPCAAPFLAPALGAALTLSALNSLLVFTFIALGLALPYLSLSAFPSMIRMLPKPGPWMESFKQFMAFLLYATVAYLLWVLAGQVVEDFGYPETALRGVLLSFVVVATAAWVWGRWGAYHRKRRTRWSAYVIALVIAAGGLAIGYPRATLLSESGEYGPVVWQKWEPGKAEALAEEGRIVYVDFTARWCVTCQTNKTAVFSSDEVLETFHELEVVPLKADWTNRDQDITKALATWGRSAVPFNLVYRPDTGKPEELPEILTPGIVLRAIRGSDK